MQLLVLCSHDLPFMSSWLNNKTNSTQWAVQNEVLEMLAHSVLRQVMAESTSFYAVMADETMDVSRKEQMVIFIRTVDDYLNITENLLGLYSMDKCDAEYIFSAILDALLRCNLPLNKLRGQAYYGVPVMQGSKSGLGKRILERENKALVIRFQAYALNLAVQDA